MRDHTQLLRDKGLKVTPGRLEVLDILERAKKPLSIKALSNRLKDTAINQATLYRTVTRLKEVGILNASMLEHNHAHYQLVTEEDTHHIVCISCHTVASFQGCVFNDLSASLLETIPSFSSIQSHTLELSGVCQLCSSK